MHYIACSAVNEAEVLLLAISLLKEFFYFLFKSLQLHSFYKIKKLIDANNEALFLIFT